MAIKIVFYNYIDTIITPVNKKWCL